MIKTLITTAALALTAFAAQADGLKDLEKFLREVNSAQASFIQVVTSPKRTGETVARSKTSSGRFEFLRPNRFRFEYTKPFEQTIVADGQTLWLYDVDLNQVTARKQQEVLGSTPAALIAAGTDLRALSEVFDLKAAPAQDGMEWLEARPRAKDGQLQSVRVGFRQGQLTALEIADSLGQRSVLTFSQWQGNAPLTAERFRFQAPAGADVIRP
ncbi:MAG: outer membrane lipoprotein chaperone LolA [Hydrogenophaga sp.]|nr:outer membrane lipoprotein chaperone LolA [Hydrogenophaga sp.]MBS3910780.1 outer membrane lipoprotein chaperone LolA [Hydrogenophaga sp.]MDO9135109.1 outer membrane lipoprotein chaperone LolA [Hydrogenophaga sp.]MDO9604109.1 outer membrane lipoprotein chaperone LolA [Hydrogenophaga sp.]MDP2166107.1 outer membrane lipoprotein chaperone LolA [Hydrogenophaga sp.]MDP3476670.1 outer membrane lipoprotein chaperone LolA [Hydrogenophaga sp.]